jgi:hypothetical protein
VALNGEYLACSGAQMLDMMRVYLFSGWRRYGAEQQK